MLDLIPFTFIGIGFGVLAGFIPGMGIFVTMMILYPWLLSFTGMELLAFYIGIASTTQYIGSITATVFAVPGESSSLPSVKEGHAMYKQGKGGYAISGAAIGSFVGSLLVLLIVSMFVPQLENLYYLYSTYIQAGIILAVMVLLIVTNKNYFVAVLLTLLGYFLASIGCRDIDQTCFGTFDNPDLTTGLPFISVVIALYIVPVIFRNWNTTIDMSNTSIEFDKFTEHLKMYFTHIWSSIRGTFIGFFAGFTPGLSTTMSANLSYAAEKAVQKKNYKEGNYGCLVSAETGNNAGAFAALLPLLVLGIPIVPSEALLYELASAKGFIMGGATFNEAFFYMVAGLLVLTNFIALAIAWPFAKYVCLLGKINYKILQSIIMVIMVGVVIHTGSQFFQAWYYFIVLLALLPIGYLLRKYDTLPLVFAFLVAGRIDVVLIGLSGLIGF